MKKLFLLITAAFLSTFSFSQSTSGNGKLRNILVITAHPEDFTENMGGTVLLLKGRFNIHMLICDPKDQKNIDVPGVKVLNGSLHFMKNAGQGIYADHDRIDQIVSLLKELDPAIIFAPWGAGSADNTAVSTMTSMALYDTHMIYDREFYFFKSNFNELFDPDFYVNVSGVKAMKSEMLTNKALRDISNNDVNSYAEPFKTYYPIINSRWGKRPQNTLLALETSGLKKADETNKNVLIIGTHPDDWEISMSGTAALMKNKYDLHVLLLTAGEMGMGKEKMEECENMRRQQAIDGCKKINASLHIMHFPDSRLTAGKELVDSILYWTQKINPRIIFIHWPGDKPDHASGGDACLKALTLNNMINDREVYFFGVQQISHKNFNPDLYVNISAVVDAKKELITIHDLPSHKKGELLEYALDMNKYFGQINNCEYAEGFLLPQPVINYQGNKKNRYSLLDL